MVRALYVTGPATLGRHLLQDGVVALGRDPAATVFVDDPRVSRMHAALHVGAEIALSDLESANGTFVDGTRLVPHRPQALKLGQPFFIGDSTLVIHNTVLPRSCAKRVNGIDEVRRRLASIGGGDRLPRMLVLNIRSARGKLQPTCESILSQVLVGPHDWLTWVGQEQVLVGVEVGADADANHTERIVAEALRDWGVRGEVSSRFVSRGDLDEAGANFSALIDSCRPVTLERGTIILREAVMTALNRTLTRVAAAPINVLVLGETGAGKDVVASMLHELSPRKGKPFVSLNCASLPEALLESELFGHEKGAFTGAVGIKPGLLETAEGGSIFLDEIGDLPLSLQAKLLRVIEAHQLTRLGATRPRQLDVRFIAATNRDLPREVEAGRFRQDLFYRLNAMTVTVPPLRERPTEIEPLARLFADDACKRFGMPAKALSAAAIAALKDHSWPGNVRELRNTVERAVLLCAGPIVEPSHLGPLVTVPAPRSNTPAAPQSPTSERARIERALAEAGGNQSRAAEALGIPRRTLVRKIARLGVPRPKTRPRATDDGKG